MTYPYPCQELGPRPGDNAGPWLRKGTAKPVPAFLPIGGLLGTPVEVRPRAPHTATSWSILPSVPTLSAASTPNLDRPITLPRVPVPSHTAIFEDALTWVGARPVDADAEHAAEMWTRENFGRFAHRATFPAVYAPRVVAPAARPSVLSSTLIPLPKERAYVPDSEGSIMTADKSRAARELWALERAADRFLREHGENVVRLDVTSRDERLPIVAPDAVAFRGVVRTAKLPSARNAPKRDATQYVAGSVLGVAGRLDAAEQDAMLGGHGHVLVTSLATRVLGRPTIVRLPLDKDGKQTTKLRHGRTVTYTKTRAPSVLLIGVPAWHGHKVGRPVPVATVRAEAGVIGTRGPAVTPMTAAARSLARAMRRSSDETSALATMLTDVLSTSNTGTVLRMTDGATVLVVNKREATLTPPRDMSTGTVSGSCREIAQRCALAGLALLD